jgi:hypothetical protein
MAWITTFAAVGSADASVRHCSTTVFTKASPACQPLCHDSERIPPGSARGQVDADDGAERHARHVGLLDPDRAEEGRDVVGIALGRVGAGRLVALAPSPEGRPR